MNAPLNTLKCRKDDITNNSLSGLPHCFPLSPSQIGLITSAFTIGGLLSAVVAGPVSDRRGRLQPMKAAALLFIIGSILESLSSHFIILVCGRFISGLAAGVSVVVVPMFISETAPAISSGFCGSLTQVTVNFGIFATQLIGHFLSYGRLWRVVLVLPSLVGLAQIVGLFTITESPVWAIRQGDFGTASTIQRRIRPKDFDLNTEMKIWRSTLYPEANGTVYYLNASY